MVALPFTGLEIRPEDVLRADGLGPDLAVDVMADSREVELHGVVIPFRRHRVIRDLAGLGVEAAHRALVHRVEPDLSFAIEVDREQALRGLGLELLDRVFDELEGLRIEFADEPCCRSPCTRPCLPYRRARHAARSSAASCRTR